MLYYIFCFKTISFVYPPFNISCYYFFWHIISAAEAERGQRWHKRETPLALAYFREVPQPTADGEDLQAAIRFHCAPDQVAYELISFSLYPSISFQFSFYEILSTIETTEARKNPRKKLWDVESNSTKSEEWDYNSLKFTFRENRTTCVERIFRMGITYGLWFTAAVPKYKSTSRLNYPLKQGWFVHTNCFWDLQIFRVFNVGLSLAVENVTQVHKPPIRCSETGWIKEVWRSSKSISLLYATFDFYFFYVTLFTNGFQKSEPALMIFIMSFI